MNKKGVSRTSVPGQSPSAADSDEAELTFQRVGDHAMGLELQIEELVEQRQRALVQHRSEDADRLLVQVMGLQDELAETAVAGMPGPTGS